MKQNTFEFDCTATNTDAEDVDVGDDYFGTREVRQVNLLELLF